MFPKIPPKFHDHILWLNLNKISEISFFYNQHINKVTPHFTFMRRAQNADTHALKQHRLSQNIFPVCSSFVLVIVSDMHLEPESEKRSFSHNYRYPDTIHTFSLFLDEFLEIDLRPIYCGLTATQKQSSWVGKSGIARSEWLCDDLMKYKWNTKRNRTEIITVSTDCFFFFFSFSFFKSQLVCSLRIS